MEPRCTDCICCPLSLLDAPEGMSLNKKGNISFAHGSWFCKNCNRSFRIEVITRVEETTESQAKKKIASYKPEFLINGVWCETNQRFATRDEASASALASVQARLLWHVITSDDQANYKRDETGDHTVDLTTEGTTK